MPSVKTVKSLIVYTTCPVVASTEAKVIITQNLVFKK